MEQTKQYEYVDLGLPSGLKWAKCNIGAEKETDFGDYFMWGSTRPNTDTPCNWKNAPFNDGSNSCNEEYFNYCDSVYCWNIADKIKDYVDLYMRLNDIKLPYHESEIEK